MHFLADYALKKLTWMKEIEKCKIKLALCSSTKQKIWIL